jgi:hypothetical protein
MSVFFTIQSAQPVITSSTGVLAINGETIFISGEQFKKNIIAISGENIYNPGLNFSINGLSNQNVSGINNTIGDDVVGFTLSGLTSSKYKIYVYNDADVSSNYINLKILDRPSISGFDDVNVLPGQYVRVSGSNFLPGANITFIDVSGNKVTPSFQETGLYRVTGAQIQNYGSGYNVGDIFHLQGLKNYNSNSYAVFTVTTTGINGSLGSFNINNSGIFTVPNQSSGIEFTPNNGTGTNALIDVSYEKYENTGTIEFLEFQVPYNIRKNQSGIVENLKYRGVTSGAKFSSFYIAGYPNIYGFYPETGQIETTQILLSGDNLSFVQEIKIGDQKIIPPFNIIQDTGIIFNIPNYSSSNYVTLSGQYGVDKSRNILNIFYPPVLASGFTPNDVLAGTGTLVNISGKYLQRINYINLGQPNILRKDITVNANADRASFILPNNYTTTSLRIFSVDFPDSGTLIESPSSNNLLISTVRLSENNVNIRYLSGIQGAKYLDEIEIYSSSGTSGDYGNLTNSDVFFLGITGHVDAANDYLISGIKLKNSATGIRFRVPREVRNPQARIRIKRNRFGESYILPSNKSIDILPTIHSCSSSNTLYNNLGYITISGINASNANLIYFSGYPGTQNLLGYKEIRNFPLEIVSKDLTQITGINGVGGNNLNGYSIFEAKLGGDITGSGELFLFNNYYDTGIGYEDLVITKNKNVRVAAISGFRPPNSDIFTSPAYVTTPLENAFFYQIQTNSRTTRFEFSATTISGVGEGDWPTGLETYLNSANQIFGQPLVGGIYYLKIRALDGERPNEGMILNLAVGYSGRSLSGPGITYRGPWRYGVGYVGSNLRRDVVKYSREGVNYWYAAYTNIDSEPQAGNPNWIPFTNEFAATATQILLAEESNITEALNIGQEGIPSGYIKTVNDKNVDEGSGFFLGYDNRYNFGKPKFRVGNQDSYIKFDGEGLDILGPLSGVITTSKNIKNANNIVEADSSVALGIDNKINRKNDNVFIFGTSNIITGSRRCSIVAGKDNKITTVQNFLSDSSTIGGGESNVLYGSYCNIVGGYGNVIDATSTGLSAIANESFITSISGGDVFLIEYLAQIFTNDLVFLVNLESNKNVYQIEHISDIKTTDYTLNISPSLENDDVIKVHSWISLLSENLYSGSFIAADGTNKVCEFKTARTGLNLGIKNQRVKFNKNFVNYTGGNTLVLMDYILSADGNYKLSTISEIDRSGFNIELPNTLNTNGYINYFIGPTGYYTGTDENIGASLQISYVYPFSNLASGNKNYFDLDLKARSRINFFNVYDRGSEYFYLAQCSGSGDNRLKFNLATEINPHSDGYLHVNALGYTGNIFNNNIQIYQTGIPSGSGSYQINLISGITQDYSTFINVIQTGAPLENYYNYYTSGLKTGLFFLNYTEKIKEPHVLNVGIYKTGYYSFDNANFYVNKITCSGNYHDNIVPINFNRSLTNLPIVFLSVENTNIENNYLLSLDHISTTGIFVKLSNSISSGESIKINCLAIDHTGNNSFRAQNLKIVDKNIDFTGRIHIDLPATFDHSELRVFTKVYTQNYVYLWNVYDKDSNSFSISLSDRLSYDNMTGLRCDYMATDLDRDFNIAKANLSIFNYARLAAFGFNDIGSSTIGGGTGNYIKGLVSSIAGGVNNTIVGDFNLIPGGRSNRIIDVTNLDAQYPKSAFCTVVGGSNNLITGNLQYTNILGGSGNLIVNNDQIEERGYSSILGGTANIVSGIFSNILGGANNIISGAYSVALGNNINITNSGSTVFSDASSGIKKISQENTMVLNFANGVYITGNRTNMSPIILDVSKLPQHTSTSSLPVGGVYRSGNFLMIKN